MDFMLAQQDKTRRRRRIRRRRRQSGAALITALLCMTLLYALALALLLSTTTDTLITSSYRASEEAFFAADAGIAMGRRAVAKAVSEQITAIAEGRAPAFRPETQILPDSTAAPDSPFFNAIRSRAASLANSEARSQFSNDAQYQIEILSVEGGPSTTPIRNEANGLESYIYRYEIRSTGKSAYGARAEVVERGELRTHLTASISVSRRPFTAYGTFFDRGDPDGGLVLVSGAFTGPVHTNSHFNFSSKNTVVFRGRVSQADDYVIYDGRSEPVPVDGKTGVVVSSGTYERKEKIPPPQNNYVQELAVVNGNGYNGNSVPGTVDGQGRVTAATLAAGLTDVNGRPPQVNGNDIPNGVYVSSTDGSTITGGGIYVNGDARIELTTSGNSQTIQIGQGASTSTVTIDYDASTTTFSSGGTTRVLTGVPMDSSLGESNQSPGISLFVDGSITSLSGPAAVEGQTGPAISPQTALTITAQRHITVTGDIKYTEPVVGADGNALPRANSVKSVLGIFTNDGNVVLQPDGSRTDGEGASMEIDASIAAFNSSKSNDGGKLEGTIVYGSGSPGTGARLKIVGARIQSNIANIKYKNRQIYYDPRLEGGNFAPPFFPGTEIKKNTSDLKIVFPGEQSVVILANSWQRDERRHKSSE